LLIILLIAFLGCTEQQEKTSPVAPAETRELPDIGNSPGNESSLEEAPEGSSNPCPDDYEPIGDGCFLKRGCAYQNPPCGQNYACIDNACVIDTEDESCMQCLDESPGNECVGDCCLKITPADCDDGKCCSGSICVERQGCHYGNPECSEDEICLNNECILKSELLPDAASSADCAYNDVYGDGKCISAAYTLHFASKGLTQEQFDEMTESVTAAFVYNTPLRNCPDKLRVHKTFQLCCEEGPCSPGPEGEYADAILYLKNNSDNRTCGPVSGANVAWVPLADPYEDTGTAVHELGHALGLLDQYCYWPFPENPNPADYEEGKCYPLDENDGLFYYCSGNEKLPGDAGVHACRGNLNPLGGLSTMGRVGDPSRDYVSHPKFGFTEEEYEHIAEQLNCG